MKKTLLGVILCIFATAVMAKTLVGYGNTKWDMTPDQVVIAEGSKVRKLSEPIKYKGSWGLVKTDNVIIANRDFDVTYLFSNNNLIQVNVSAKEKKNALINNDVFKRLEALLTQKYGSPTYSDQGKSTVWNLEGTTIMLNILNIDGVMSNLVISYKPASASRDEANAL